MLLFIWFLLYFSCFYFVSSLTFKSSSVILEYNECTIKQQLCIFRKALIIYRNRSGKETNNVSFWHPHTFYRQRSRNHLYHLWHGKSSQQKGLKLLGISDHGPGTLASGTSSYFRSLPFYPRKRFGIDILYGVELNILDSAGHTDLSDELLNNLDYAIISMHRQNYRSGSVSQNTEAYINAMKHPAVKILGHCDDTHFPVDYETLARAALRENVIFEINEASSHPEDIGETQEPMPPESCISVRNISFLLFCPATATEKNMLEISPMPKNSFTSSCFRKLLSLTTSFPD